MAKKKKKQLSSKDFVSTGSTMLNLACTDDPFQGFAKGHYYLIVGTSRSGKTWLSLSCLAEAAKNPNFDDHLFIYNNIERGALMNIPKFFGEDVDKRLKVVHSYRIEDFYDHIDRVMNRGFPFIYILDSMDALTSEQEIKTFKKQKTARTEEKDAKGSYGDGKAKVNSQNLRRVIGPIEKTGSILLIINQTRDKLTGFGGKTHSGGNALQFYATLEIWSDIKGKIEKIYRKKKRFLGNHCTLRIRKNRVTGKDRTIEVPIYTSYGMDDIGSCAQYLIGEHHWTKNKKGIVTAPEFDFEGHINDLVQYISKNEMEKDLAMIAGEVWNDIEEAIAIKRKPRYV